MYNLTEPIELGVVAGTEYKFYYTLTMFADRTLAVVIDCEDPELNFREPYSTLTVNLSDYQRVPNEGEIFIHHNSVNTEAFELFYEKFCDKDFGKQPISYGYASSVKVKFADGILPEGIKGQLVNISGRRHRPQVFCNKVYKKTSFSIFDIFKQ